ncbi:MAG TPA: hypothetical protein VFN21_07785 [Acidimicrobiales bacterium]|nr:hypothetical protein [Acidimicrobiales bacterium]
MALLLMLQRRFFSRFMEGRAGPWGALAAGVFGFRMLVKWGRRSEDVAYRAVLKPGETVTIAHTADTEVSLKRDALKVKRDGRKAKRAAKKVRRRAISGAVTVETSTENSTS